MFVVSSVTVMHFCLSVIGIYLMKFFFFCIVNLHVP